MASINVSPQKAAEKWKRRLQGATEDIRNGIEAVTESPMAKAASNPEKYLSGVQAAVTSGKWQAGLNRVSLADWKQAILTKGIQRISGGAEAAEAKVADFYGDLFAFEERLMNQIDQMPDVSLEDSIARSAAWMRGMAEFRRS